MRWILLVPLLLLLSISVALADDFTSLYESAKLSREQPRFEGRIRGIFTKGIWPSLPANEQQALETVAFEFPLVSEVSRGPLDHHSGKRGHQYFVALPVLSLLFLEDLCTAYAWLWSRGHSLEAIDQYVAMLAHKPAASFPGGRYPRPLQAMQIPSDALADKKVDQLSLRLRNSAFAFILLHELGHILDLKNQRPTPRTSLSEEYADLFAIKTLDATTTAPMGATLYFLVHVLMAPSTGKSTRTKDRDTTFEIHADHPLTVDRLTAIALALDKTASEASIRGRPADPTYSDVLRYIGTKLVSLRRLLTDRDLQQCIATSARQAQMSILAPRAPARSGTYLDSWCGDGKG